MEEEHEEKECEEEEEVEEKKVELDLRGGGEVVGRDWGEVKEREEEVVDGRGGGIRKYGRG